MFGIFKRKPKRTLEESIIIIQQAGARLDDAFAECKSRGFDPLEEVGVTRTVHHPFFSISFDVTRYVPRWQFFHRA